MIMQVRQIMFLTVKHGLSNKSGGYFSIDYNFTFGGADNCRSNNSNKDSNHTHLEVKQVCKH